MLILRSFCRKKSTKIYIVIISLILVVSSILIIGRNYFNSYLNDIYEDSYMIVESNTNIKKHIEKNRYVKKVYDGIAYDKETLGEVLVRDDKVTDNKLFYPYYIKNLKDVTIVIENNEYMFTPIKGDNAYYCISNYMYNKIKSDNNIENYIYIIELKNWLNTDSLEKSLYKNFNVENVETYTRTKKNINFDIKLIILIFNVVSVLLLILFTIILIFSITNIREDESNNKYLLRCLGYNHKKIIYFSSIKIIWLFLISSMINFTLISVTLFSIDLFIANIKIDFYITNIVFNIGIFISMLILSISRYICYSIKEKLKK